MAQEKKFWAVWWTGQFLAGAVGGGLAYWNLKEDWKEELRGINRELSTDTKRRMQHEVNHKYLFRGPAIIIMTGVLWPIGIPYFFCQTQMRLSMRER